MTPKTVPLGQVVPTFFQKFFPLQEGVDYTLGSETKYDTINTERLPSNGRFQTGQPSYPYDRYSTGFHVNPNYPFNVWVFTQRDVWSTGRAHAIPTREEDIDWIRLAPNWSSMHDVTDIEVHPFTTVEGFETHQIKGLLNFGSNEYEVRITIGAMPFGNDPDSGTMLFATGGAPTSSLYIKMITPGFSHDGLILNGSVMSIGGRNASNRFALGEMQTMALNDPLRATDRISGYVSCYIRIAGEHVWGEPTFDDLVVKGHWKLDNIPVGFDGHIISDFYEPYITNDPISVALPVRIAENEIRFNSAAMRKFVHYHIGSTVPFEIGFELLNIDVKRV